MTKCLRVFGFWVPPEFEREFRNIADGNPQLSAALEELLAVLRNDPHNRSGQHNIKKLAQVKAGEGQWRFRWRDYRLRYDIYAGEVVLFSFRHRKESD